MNFQPLPDSVTAGHNAAAFTVSAPTGAGINAPMPSRPLNAIEDHLSCIETPSSIGRVFLDGLPPAERLASSCDLSIARVQYKASTRLIETGKPTLGERSYNPK